MKTNAQIILKKISISFLLLLICQCCFAGSAGEPTSMGEWSDATNGMRARLVISEDTDISGSRTALAYLELQNTSSTQNTLYVYHDPSNFSELSCELRNTGGKEIGQVLGGIDGELPPSCWLALPYDSTITFRPISLAKWVASNGELNICGGMNYWRIPRGNTNNYYLSGTLTLTVPKGETHPQTSQAKYFADTEWQGTLKLPPVKISAKNLSKK